MSGTAGPVVQCHISDNTNILSMTSLVNWNGRFCNVWCLCYREKEKKAEELQKEEDEALQHKAKLEDMFMERRRLEERRKNMELGYAIIVTIVLPQLEIVHCLDCCTGMHQVTQNLTYVKSTWNILFCKIYIKYPWCVNVTLCSDVNFHYWGYLKKIKMCPSTVP